VAIPYQIADHDVRHSRGDVRWLAGKEALVVVGNDVLRDSITRQLASYGMHCHATTAVQSVARFCQEAPLDFLIVDNHVPDIDGLLVSEALRARVDGTFPAVVTLAALRDPPLTVTGAGTVVCLHKPVRPAQLSDTLQRAMAGKRLAPVSTEQGRWDATLGTRHPLHILLAEDNLINQKVLLQMLQRCGYAADVVADGAQALAALSTTAYDLVLMDIQMPVLDGEEATRRIRKELRSANQPYIIAVTANAFEDQKLQYLRAGMDDYLSKPVEPGKLMAALTRCWLARQSNGRRRSTIRAVAIEN
jgi:CheY-like chemotaxis protein